MDGTNNIVRQAGAISLALLLAVSMVAGVGGIAAAHDTGADDSDGDKHDGMKSGDGDDGVFSEEITLVFAGITITFGPPQDLDDDGVYEDVTGDGETNLFDAIAHAALVTAVNEGALDLTDEQADAVDVDRDGDVDYDDALALADTTGSGAMV